jgi:hypothetical protein
MRPKLVGPDGAPLSASEEERQHEDGGQSKLFIATVSGIAGLLLGSGGVFGVVKWLDTRTLDKLQTQYEIAKNQADLAEQYRALAEKLEKQLNELQANSASDPGRQQEISSLQSQLRIVQENLQYLLSRSDLPEWAKEHLRLANNALGPVVNR